MTAALMQFIMALVAVAAVARVEGTLEANAVSRDLEVNLVVPFDFAHHMMCWRSCFPDYLVCGRGEVGREGQGSVAGGGFLHGFGAFLFGARIGICFLTSPPRATHLFPPHRPNKDLCAQKI